MTEKQINAEMKKLQKMQQEGRKKAQKVCGCDGIMIGKTMVHGPGCTGFMDELLKILSDPPK